MPIFGQVWLWSSLAFLLGALLCWALVALPARRRVAQLESRLAARARRSAPSEPSLRPVESDDFDYDERRPMVPGLGRYGDDLADDLADDLHDEPRSESLTRAYAMPEVTRNEPDLSRLRTPPDPVPGSLGSALDGGLVTPPSPPEPDPEPAGPRAAATQYINVSATSLGSAQEAEDDRGWFDDDGEGAAAQKDAERHTPEPGEIDGRLVDDSDESVEESATPDDGGTVFTQHTHPIPADVIKQIDEAGKTAVLDEPAGELVDDLADDSDGTHSAERTVESEPVTPPARPESTQVTEALPAPAEARTEVVPGRGQPSGETTTSLSGVALTEPARNPLPKRVPSKPQQRAPFGNLTSSSASSSASPQEPFSPFPSSSPEPASPSSGDVTRSLFEPIVPAEDNNSAMPTTNLRHGNGSGRGPFGPGSAMPLPDGGSPSPEFTIKASVSALRYCTPESPQFGRTVAEVWFKTSADAERVGFRPVG